jgi:metal-responsive CopG/Arc/MetJ family transcriptional regulator
MSAKDKLEITTFTLPKGDRDKLKAIAKEEFLTVSQIIRKLVSNYIREYESAKEDRD